MFVTYQRLAWLLRLQFRVPMRYENLLQRQHVYECDLTADFVSSPKYCIDPMSSFSNSWSLLELTLFLEHFQPNIPQSGHTHTPLYPIRCQTLQCRSYIYFNLFSIGVFVAQVLCKRVNRGDAGQEPWWTQFLLFFVHWHAMKSSVSRFILLMMRTENDTRISDIEKLTVWELQLKLIFLSRLGVTIPTFRRVINSVPFLCSFRRR